MKAIVRDRYGPPEQLRWRDMPDPVPTGDQVLVRMANRAQGFWNLELDRRL